MAVRHLTSRPGLLGSLLSRSDDLCRILDAFLVGGTRLLCVGGEPGNGKSLLAGEILLACRDLGRAGLISGPAPAVITYDFVHSAFLERLFASVGEPVWLPEGETYPLVRQYVSDVLRDTLLFALLHLPASMRIVAEIPLVDIRGESAVDQLIALRFPVQTVIVDSPEMWREVVAEGERISDRSAQRLAMLQIRQRRLQRLGVANLTPVEQDQARIDDWLRWLEGRDGMLLSWNPNDCAEALEVTKQALQDHGIIVDRVMPVALARCVPHLCDATVAMIPDVPALIDDFRAFVSATSP